eukprot:3521942-Rhodomonas_salina.1
MSGLERTGEGATGFRGVRRAILSPRQRTEAGDEWVGEDWGRSYGVQRREEGGPQPQTED